MMGTFDQKRINKINTVKLLDKTITGYILRKPPSPFAQNLGQNKGGGSWGSDLDHIPMTSFGGFGARRRREKNRVFEQFPP